MIAANDPSKYQLMAMNVLASGSITVQQSFDYINSIYVDDKNEKDDPSEGDYQFINTGSVANPNYVAQQYKNNRWINVTYKQCCYVMSTNEFYIYTGERWVSNINSVYVENVGEKSDPNVGDYSLVNTGTAQNPNYVLEQYNNNHVWEPVIIDVQGPHIMFCYIINTRQIFYYTNIQGSWKWVDITNTVYVDVIGPTSGSHYIGEYRFINNGTDQSPIYVLQQYDGSNWSNVEKDYCYVLDGYQIFKYTSGSPYGTWDKINSNIKYIYFIGTNISPNQNDYQFINDNGVYRLQQYTAIGWVDVSNINYCYIISYHRMFVFENNIWHEEDEGS